MLKLVVDNTVTEQETDSAFSNLFTCKDCVYYLSKSDSCSLQLAADSNNPLIPYECGNFEETYEIGTEDPLNSHIHQRLREEKAQILAENYPAQPSIDPIHKEAIWYGSADYGCWIVNDSKKRFALAEQVPFNDNISLEKYTSPFPLHDHGAKEGIRHYMCWYVNEKGIGEYHLLIGGVIMKIAEGVKKLGFNH
ncbi:hypothetical protein [Bacillus mycoides]|jgi:hypothetical protein|uniref:hypothetical protein n=1 Tax=Bacillus mycoides TaxID=1405 RepID=UPI001879A707|nr:hypothetical protein [Bacillus mycoides]MBE7128972.1 hypothetical protein [Bacillus mycoides]